MGRKRAQETPIQLSLLLLFLLHLLLVVTGRYFSEWRQLWSIRQGLAQGHKPTTTWDFWQRDDTPGPLLCPGALTSGAPLKDAQQALLGPKRLSWGLRRLDQWDCRVWESGCWRGTFRLRETRRHLWGSLRRWTGPLMMVTSLGWLLKQVGGGTEGGRKGMVVGHQGE